MSDLQIVPVNQRSALIYQSTDDNEFLLINWDENNTIYIDDNPGVNPSNSATGFIPPLGSLTFGGHSTVYGACLPGQTANVQITPNATGFQASPSQIAAEIIASGIPLLANPVPLYTVNNQSVNAGVAQVLTPLILVTMGVGGAGSLANFLSYEFSSKLTIASTTEVSPRVQLQIDFYENATDTTPVDSIIWTINASNAGHVTFGRGPLRGNYIQVTLTNTPSVSTVTINSIRITGTSRTCSRDDWREINQGNLTPVAIKIASGDIRQNIAGVLNSSTINGATSTLRQVQLFQGDVRFFIEVTGLTTNQLELFITDPQTPINVEHTFLGAAGNGRFEGIYTFPRIPMQIDCINNTVSTPAVVTWSVTAQSPT